jgi:hypothetical protein
MRRLGGLLTLLLLLQAGAALADPDAGMKLDPRFGRGGVVRVHPRLPGHAESFPYALVGTGNGGFFALERATGAGCKRCSDWYLVRYGRGGARDRSFGFVPIARGIDYYAYLDLAVDAVGRPLVFSKEGGDAVVERLTPRGRVDRGFGKRGRFVLHCGCYPESLLALPHGRLLLLSEGNDRSQRHYKGSIPVIVRIRRDGTLDRGYGRGGVARPRLHGRFSPQDFVVNPGGGVVLAGDTCCGLGPGPYVTRLRANGRIDRSFGRAARQAVKRLPGSAEVLFVHGLVGHRDGSVDLYGGLDFNERSFVLRLGGDGSLDRSFGRLGMKDFRFSLGAVGSDGRGGALVQGDGNLYRLGPEVRPQAAPRVRYLGGESEGISIEPQRGGTVLVFDSGADAGCRQSCSSVVKVTRLRLSG